MQSNVEFGMVEWTLALIELGYLLCFPHVEVSLSAIMVFAYG
jgi:hypothetical protein